MIEVMTEEQLAEQAQQINEVFPPEAAKIEAQSQTVVGESAMGTMAYSRSFLHHGVICEISCEINSTCTVLAFVNGEAVYARHQVYRSELEGYLVTAMKLVEVEAERRHPLGVVHISTQRMLLRLGFVKQETTF